MRYYSSMSGVMVLLLLILISSILAIAVFVWFRLARYEFPVLLFFCSLLAGATSFFPALLLQEFVPEGGALSVYIRAFTEELSRLLPLIILLLLFRRFAAASNNGFTTGTAAGLVAGLGFAILEGAVYSAANPDITLLRACTAAPLHGACGSRVGSAVVLFRENPARAITQFLFTVVIHGTYNTLLRIPGILSLIAAVLIALSAFASSVLTIRREMTAP